MLTKQEGLAVLWAVYYFKLYITGMSFVLITDHLALQALYTKEELAGQMQRFANKLSTFDYYIKYRPGSENFTPDLLSH